MNPVISKLTQLDAFQLQRRVFIPSKQAQQSEIYPAPETTQETDRSSNVNVEKEIEEIFAVNSEPPVEVKQKRRHRKMTRQSERSLPPSTAELSLRGEEQGAAWLQEKARSQLPRWNSDVLSAQPTKLTPRKQRSRSRMYDEEYDRGKVKRIRTKTEPKKTDYNPFQAAFEDSLR